MASVLETREISQGKIHFPPKKGGKNKFWGTGFSKTSLKTAVNHLIENYYLDTGNVTMN